MVIRQAQAGGINFGTNLRTSRTGLVVLLMLSKRTTRRPGVSRPGVSRQGVSRLGVSRLGTSRLGTSRFLINPVHLE